MHRPVLLLIIIIIFIAILCSPLAFTKEIIIPGPQSEEDASHQYYISLLNLALEKTKDNHPYTSIRIKNISESTHGRSLLLLEKNIVNLFWAGTNKAREQKLTPIRIPLFKGLLGYRVSMIKKENLAEFAQLSMTELKNKVACQGIHWPDSDILASNGYKVMRVARFDLMFTMLEQKRCDYFPRAIFEGYAELKIAQKKYPDLIIFDNTILQYTFPIYFFTNKHQSALVKQITLGLRRAIADGSLDKLMKNDPMTKPLFPLSQWQNKRYFRLKNKTLPKSTPLDNQALWIDLQPNTHISEK